MTSPAPTNAEIETRIPPDKITPTGPTGQDFTMSGSSDYNYPQIPDLSRYYLFYLHGKIIEDQGLPAVSPIYGEYEYDAILEKLSMPGYVVFSEQRTEDTDGAKYAARIEGQIADLIAAGVPASQITVAGASKGAGIAIYVSHYLNNQDLNYVLLGGCPPDDTEMLINHGIYLSGNVLSIYDSADELAGSCQELFALSEGRGISRYGEIVLHVGTGHGILYHPLDEWITPLFQWIEKK